MFEDLKKKEREGLLRGRSRIPLLHVADPKRRIFVLCGLLIVLIVIFLGLRNYASTPEASEPIAEVPTKGIGVSNAPLRIPGVPTLDTELAMRVNDTGDAARRRWEPEAISYLLVETGHTPAVHAYKKNLLPIEPGSAAQIDQDSRPWRFKFVRFRGRLEYIREEDYEQQYGGKSEIGRIHRGRILVAPGDPPVRVVFLTPFMPLWTDPNSSDPTPPTEMIEDGWVRGRGILVKNFLEEGPGGKEVPAILVVATSLERDYETQPVESLADIPFQIVADDPLWADDPHRRKLLFKKYPKTMFRLIKYAEARAGEAGAAKRAEEGLEPESFEKPETHEEVIGQPDRYRAKYFGGKGIIAQAAEHYGPEETEANDAGVDEFVHGWIATDRRKLFEFVAPAALAGDWKRNTRIRYEGFFYKTQAYPAREGTDRLAPLLVLTVLEKVPPPVEDRTGQFIFAMGFLVGILLLVFFIVREDKTKLEYRRHRRRVVPG